MLCKRQKEWHFTGFATNWVRLTNTVIKSGDRRKLTM